MQEDSTRKRFQLVSLYKKKARKKKRTKKNKVKNKRRGKEDKKERGRSVFQPRYKSRERKKIFLIERVIILIANRPLKMKMKIQ